MCKVFLIPHFITLWLYERQNCIFYKLLAKKGVNITWRDILLYRLRMQLFLIR